MDTAALERLDSFPYRHHAAELMTQPVVTIASTLPIADAARMMSERRISSLVIVDGDGRLHGILTERDVLRLAAGHAALTGPVSSAMSSPVHAIEPDAPIYRVMARMARLVVRHLVVVDDHNRPVGILTAAGLLKQRAQIALTLGDEIAVAPDSASLRAGHDKLPGLVRALHREEVTASQISAVIAGITRDLTARAAELALAEMKSTGQGEPPAPWCLLVLGSAGRGESLLAPDQDNALIHEGGERDDTWFATFAERLNRVLDEAGVPYCKGGVMARNAPWRHSLGAWCNLIDEWIARPQPAALLGVDIFYDFVGVLGDRRLAGALRQHAVRAAARSPTFLRLLAAASEEVPSATDLLGRLRTQGGRIDLKLHGLFPIVAAARVAALAWGSSATSTDARLAEAAAKGALEEEAARSLVEARGVIVETILEQQLADIAAARTPDNRVDPGRLGRRAASRLRSALAVAARTPALLHDILSNRPIAGTS